MMGMGYGFSPFAAIFVLLYAGVVVFALVQLTGINQSLKRIATALEKSDKDSKQ